MACQAMHMTVTIRNPAIGKQDGDLVQRLRGVRPEVPHHLRTFQVALRQAFLGVDKIGKLQRVADKEYTGVLLQQCPSCNSSV